MSASVAALLPLFLAGGAPEQDRWADQPHGPSYPVTAPAMDVTIRTRLMPQVEALIQKLLRERRATTLAGVKVFESGDKFLPGKLAVAMAYRVTELPAGDSHLAQRLTEFAEIAALTVDDANDSWGIYYYMTALDALHQRGLLERALPAATLAKFRARLDWRRFVDGKLKLIALPNNYYGVAFSIARLRYRLGWEDASASEQLLARMLDHYRLYSGAYGFADETEGKGRFDRYSVLLIGEIAQRLVETGMTPSDEVKAWLRRSVDLLLPRFNVSGEGFEYGRSIGTYGETAFLEVLTAAARLKILTPVEERMAYAFSTRIAARYMDFWVDPATGSVDMWGQGRRTDTYRGISRVFGENLSLARQYIYTNAIWNDLGYRGKAPDRGYPRWLATLPRLTTTWFARGDYDRALITLRDGARVIGLPLINGADGQHMNSPYFPVPFSPGMLEGSADGDYPHLVPRITLPDGSVLMPLAFFKNVRVTRHGRATEIRWQQDALDRMGGKDAQPDSRAMIETRYVFAPGKITREDRLTVRGGTPARIDMEFASFSRGGTMEGLAAARFAHGEVRSFAADGYGRCTIKPGGGRYAATTGSFAQVVACTGQPALARDGTITLRWMLSYN